jgi:hypothetical protein
MKKLKIIGLSLLLVALVGFTAFNYVMHGGARNLASEDTAFTVTSKNISTEFNANLEMSNKKYLEKAIAITGLVTAVNDTVVTLDNTIICNLKSPDSSIKKDQAVTVKGRVVGFDDLMGELKLDQCFIIKN